MPVLAAALCMMSGFFLPGLGLTGLGVTSLGRRSSLGTNIVLRSSLAVGYGLGLFSVIFLFAKILNIKNLAECDLAAVAFLALCFFILRRRDAAPYFVSSDDSANSLSGIRSFLTCAFVVSLAVALYAAVRQVLAHPQGNGWDAFSIWNLHARFLFRGGANWRDGFTPLIPWSHPDYPLLLPGAIAHFWTYLGYESPAVPAAIGFAFTFATAGLLFSSLSILRGANAAALGGITLLTTPAFIELGASQYADLPLSFFLLAAVALLCFDDNRNGHDFFGRSSLLMLAGLAAGFAAWTKNEGLLFVFSIVAARLLVIARGKNITGEGAAGSSREFCRAVCPLLLAIAPALLLIVWFKHSIAPPGDLFSNRADTIHKLLEPSRYWAVIKWYAKGFFRFGNWLLIPGTILLAAFYFVVRKNVPKDLREGVHDGEQPLAGSGFQTSVLALGFILVGYFFVYIVTPYDIYWHLRFSLSRLFLQLWPSAVFLFWLKITAAKRVSSWDSSSPLTPPDDFSARAAGD
jgi:hypothetical protein